MKAKSHNLHYHINDALSSSIVITTSYNKIQQIISIQLGSTRGPDDPYTFTQYKDGIVAGGLSCDSVYFHGILRCSSANEIFHSFEEVLIFSLEYEHETPACYLFVLRGLDLQFLKHSYIFGAAMWQHQCAKTMKELCVGNL